MYRKIRNILAALAISGFSLFQANGCDVAAQAFIEGFEEGYLGETGGSLFSNIGWDNTSYDTGYSDYSDYGDYGC